MCTRQQALPAQYMDVHSLGATCATCSRRTAVHGATVFFTVRA